MMLRPQLPSRREYGLLTVLLYALVYAAVLTWAVLLAVVVVALAFVANA